MMTDDKKLIQEKFNIPIAGDRVKKDLSVKYLLVNILLTPHTGAKGFVFYVKHGRWVVISVIQHHIIIKLILSSTWYVLSI